MRLAQTITAAIGLTLIGIVPSSAAQGPWCLRVGGHEWTIDKCEYRSFEACYQERMSEGSTSHCFPNPSFSVPAQSDRKSAKPKGS